MMAIDKFCEVCGRRLRTRLVSVGRYDTQTGLPLYGEVRYCPASDSHHHAYVPNEAKGYFYTRPEIDQPQEECDDCQDQQEEPRKKRFFGLL